ncbi:hypothetical protein CYMTET_39330 [Cymbomonas tetramitiformis]|uniref:Uncharacterized protein n=1 Tax=Cymbomonas tetramitiformis TaxID=36881 RepID=A0AAE0CA84_9CHLO|nr:hypothetical protein CYMTET_39330 [Cymbomonas tetramitiformis]
MNLYSADDDTVRRSYLAEFVTAEMQAAYDDEDDAAFDDICDAYGKAEVHKGPSANTFSSTAVPDREPSLRQQYFSLKELSGGRFAPIDPPSGAHSLVLKDANVSAAPPRVHVEEKPKIVVDKKLAFRTASVVHNDDRELWRDWESPVLDMTPTQDSHFDALTVCDNAIGGTVDEECNDVYKDALAAEVVSDLPPESFVEDFCYPLTPFRPSEIDKFSAPLRQRPPRLLRSRGHCGSAAATATSPEDWWWWQAWIAPHRPPHHLLLLGIHVLLGGASSCGRYGLSDYVMVDLVIV